MRRFFVNILLVFCVVIPCWAKFTKCAYVGHIYWDNWRKTSVFLYCDTVANDTIWSLELQGYVSDDYLLLFKSGDGKVLELKPYDRRFDCVTDSVGHSPLTGEIIEFFHHEAVLYYYITSTALNYFAVNGISKMRCGTERHFMEKVFPKNEFANKLASAHKMILEMLSPDYEPPEAPSIRDGF